jgi:hypothetical protein
MKYVYVLTEETDDGTTVVGVYKTHESAVKERNAIIRDYFDIPEDEVADADLEDEVSGSVTYDIVQRKLL